MQTEFEPIEIEKLDHVTGGLLPALGALAGILGNFHFNMPITTGDRNHVNAGDGEQTRK